VDAVDALRILRYVAGLDPGQPPGCTPIGATWTSPSRGDPERGVNVWRVTEAALRRAILAWGKER